MKEDVNDLLKHHTITICRSTVTKYREIKKSIQLTIFGCHNNPLSANELVVCLNCMVLKCHFLIRNPCYVNYVI